MRAGMRDEHARALAIGRTDEARRPRAGRPACSSAGRRTSSTSTVTVRSAAPPVLQHRRVQALQQLSGHVERDIGPSLEVRADGPDRDPPLADLEPVRERPRGDLALERLDRGDRGDLLRDRRRRARRPAAAGRASPRRVGPSRASTVGLVRGEDLRPALAHERRRGRQRVGDRIVGEARSRPTGLERLALDLIAQRDGGHGRILAQDTVR